MGKDKALVISKIIKFDFNIQNKELRQLGGLCRRLEVRQNALRQNE